jgi:hypothetical protein
MEDGAGVATLVQEVPIHVQVESAERQTIPLFKVKRPAQLAKHARPPDETRRLGGGTQAVGQTLRVEVGQFVGLASADGPMHLARLSSTGAPGFWCAPPPPPPHSAHRPPAPRRPLSCHDPTIWGHAVTQTCRAHPILLWPGLALAGVLSRSRLLGSLPRPAASQVREHVRGGGSGSGHTVKVGRRAGLLYRR